MEKENIRAVVRDGYARVAKGKTACCPPATPCCGPETASRPADLSRKIGYTETELASVPEGANLGLGCGNPVALAGLREGETVLDLGSGPGLDCFLAAQKVGSSGKVIGVDMTPEMVEKARRNARQGDYGNVEFRLGEIENLPVADSSVDTVISNCVINLSPDKERVFKEALRVLRPGGRLMISDIVLLKDLPESVRGSVEAYIGCVAGAMLKDEYLGVVRKAGFQEVRVMGETSFALESLEQDPNVKTIVEDLQIPPGVMRDLIASAVSLKVQALKPA